MVFSFGSKAKRLHHQDTNNKQLTTNKMITSIKKLKGNVSEHENPEKLRFRTLKPELSLRKILDNRLSCRIFK